MVYNKKIQIEKSTSIFSLISHPLDLLHVKCTIQNPSHIDNLMSKMRK